MEMSSIRLVLFDLGGVVFPSPFPAIRRLEDKLGVPATTILQVIKHSGDDGAWAQLERGEITTEEFDELFCLDCERHANTRQIRGSHLLNALDTESLSAAISAPVRRTIQRLRERGVATAALSNVWNNSLGGQVLVELSTLFSLIVQSCEVGARKPERRIYEIALQMIRERVAGCSQIEPAQIVFLDDIGSNLKSARDLGMKTIHVVPERSIEESLAQLNKYIPGIFQLEAAL